MKLTKDRCLSALEWAGDCFFEDTEGRQWDFKSFSDYKVLEQVINDYFDLIEEYKECRKELESYYEMMSNPPLKLEELEENMTVWDNKFKEWCLITMMCGKYPHKRYLDGTIDDSEFEEGRFFRKKVEE